MPSSASAEQEAGEVHRQGARDEADQEPAVAANRAAAAASAVRSRTSVMALSFVASSSYFPASQSISTVIHQERAGAIHT
jgi:hypothetical protein